MDNWFRTVNRFRDPNGAHRVAQFIDILRRFPPGHMLDIGAGHGIFSRIAAQLGWSVTAVDARSDRFPNDDTITWIVSDIREFTDFRNADLVACLGLWYHLTLDDQLNLAARIYPLPLILETHVATPIVPDYHNKARVGPLVSVNGYRGREYNERDLDTPTSSWGNDVSFFPTVATLEKQLYGAGYDVVDQIAPPHRPDRTFFIAQTLDLVGLEDLVSQFNPVMSPDQPVDETSFPSLDFS